MKAQLLTPTAKPPIKVDPNAVGWDVFADTVECKDGMLIYTTGIAVEPPEGYFFAIYPRSSQSGKECIFGNSVGVIENQFRGNIQVRLRPVGNYYTNNFKNEIRNNYVNTAFPEDQDLPFQIGDRIAQLVLHPIVNDEIELVLQLSETNRGTGGFGSTGK